MLVRIPLVRIACVALVIGFRSSTGLAAAYGTAVTATMVITTVLLYVALRSRFRWRTGVAAAVCTGFLTVEAGSSPPTSSRSRSAGGSRWWSGSWSSR